MDELGTDTTTGIELADSHGKVSSLQELVCDDYTTSVWPICSPIRMMS